MISPNLSHTISFLLSRVITPLWLLTGALFKLYFDAPSTLPRTVWVPLHELGLDLQLWLHIIIGFEFILFGIMVFSARWARFVAISLLIFFSIILINEIRVGSDSCGCMGGVHTPPLLILIIDAIILIGELVFKPAPLPKREKAEGLLLPRLRPLPVALALIWVCLSFGAAFGVPQIHNNVGGPDGGGAEVAINSGGEENGGDERTDEGGAGTPASTDGQASGSAAPNEAGSDEKPGRPAAPRRKIRLQRPPAYYIFEPEQWVGKHWANVELSAWFSHVPKDYDVGRRYIVLYNPTCSHCNEVLGEFFIGDLPAPATTVKVPEYKTRFERHGVYSNPCRQCEKLQLKFGCDWIIEPPIIVALEDGIVKSAVIVQDVLEPEGLLWHDL